MRDEFGMDIIGVNKIVNRYEVLEMYAFYCSDERPSCQVVGEKFGVDRRMVHYFFKREKLPMRKKFFVKADHQTFNGKTFSCRADKSCYRMTSGSREMMHRYVYRITHDLEQIPPGYCVVHRDGDYRNNKPHNLELVKWDERTKYARHNNRFTKGRRKMSVSRFCLHCGSKIKGSPSYITGRTFCSTRCLGEYRKGTRKGLSIERIQAEKAYARIYGVAFHNRNTKKGVVLDEKE